MKKIELFIPKTKKARDLVKNIEKYNELREYLESDEVKQIIVNDFGTKPEERYIYEYFDGTNVCSSPIIGRVLFEYPTGKAKLTKDFIRVKRDGKVGKQVDFSTDSKFNPAIEIIKVPNDYTPGKIWEFITIKNAIKNFPENKKTKLVKKLSDLFEKYNLEFNFRLKYFFASNEIFIDSICCTSETLCRLRYEKSKFFTVSLLHRDQKQKERVEARIAKGYDKLTLIYLIETEFNSWLGENGYKSKIRFAFSCNSLIMFHKLGIEFCEEFGGGASGVTQFDCDIIRSEYDEDEIMREIDIKIP